MDYKTKQFKDLLDKSKKIVFMTGAGVSTHSGIPDYRSAGGIYTDNPEYMLSEDCWKNEYIKFLQFVTEHFDMSGYEPNDIHNWIAGLEKDKEITVVTQNIDGLHQRSGSTNVITYHGDINNWECKGCFTKSSFAEIKNGNNYCSRCGCKLSPEVVLYGQDIYFDKDALAKGKIKEADLVIVIGTSLSVFPFADLVQEAMFTKSVLLNATETANYFNAFDLVFLEDAIEVIKRVEDIES
jgi:NAD-dependent deacetylase